MFDLKNTLKYKKKEEQRFKTAAIIVAIVTIVLYSAFIIAMLATKLGILSAFVKTKPVINSVSVTNEPAYDYINSNYDFYYKRFNWLYDGEDYKLYFVFDSDLNKVDNNDYVFDENSFSKFGWYWFEESGSNYENVKYWTYMTQENFSINLYKYEPYKEDIVKIFPDILRVLDTKESRFKIPSASTIIVVFGIFMLISSLLKIFSIVKSYNNKKLEFNYGTLIVKLSCVFDIVGIIVLTYVFFFLYLWDIPIFYNVTEPSLIYYLLFALPIIGLSALYTSLFTRAANEENKI